MSFVYRQLNSLKEICAFMAVALFSKDVDVHASAAMVVLDTYPRMMVEIIANQWRPKHVLKLTRNDKSFMQKITPLEAKMISKLDVTGYNDLDVSCIYKLIRHFKLLPVPNQGWGNKPLKADTKEEDDVERIRRYRNDILHRPRGGLSEQDGQDFFQDSYDMAKRLDISIGSPMNGFESQIKALQCLRVDKQTYIKALEKCAEYQAQLQETRDTPNVDLYYGNDIILKIGRKDSQAASADSRCAIYIRDPSLDVNAIIQNIEDIKKTLEMGHYSVIKLDGAESGSLILHISIPNACFVTEDTLHDSLRSFLYHFFLIAGIHSKTGHSFTIVLAESERYITDTDEQDLEYLSETPLPILKLDVNVHHSAFQNENVLYKEVNEFITKMYDAIDSNGVPVNGSQREVMMITGSENDTKKQLKESDTDAQLQETRDTRKVELHYEKDTLLKLSNNDNQEASDDCGAAGETKPEGFSVDDHWRKLVMEIYYNHIISTVKASEIIINLSSSLTLDEKRSIRQRERHTNSEEAMELLLDKFDEKDCPGKWIEFRSALVEADYEWIVKAIEGDVYFTELTTWQNMMISSKIIPSILLHDLCNEKIISQQSSEEIRKEQQDKGDISAAFLLLASIPRMHSQWYPKFMEILFLNGWDELVADVDADEWKRLNRKHEHKMSDNAKYYADQSLCINREKKNMKKILPSKFQQSYIQENYESYTSKFNMSSNDRLEQGDGHYLHRSTMMELSIADDYPLYDTRDEITRETQLARTSQVQLPVPSRTGQIGQTFPSVPQTSVNEPQPTDEEYVSIMLQDVKRNLEMEVNDEPEQNISINVETTKTTTHSLETMKVLSEVAKSVGHIIGPKESGTCWRVGYDKIITAAHVVLDNIWNPMIGYLYEKDLDKFRVDFECVRKESSSHDQFKVVPSVLFMDERLDVAVLQLKPDEKKPFPPLLKMFHVLNPEKDQHKQIYLISHNQSKKKGVNSGIGTWKPTEKKLQYLERFCQQYGEENGYIELDRKDRLVIQCEFVGGASGSPGIVIFDSVAYVVFVYIRGFPSFYYNKKLSKKQRKTFPTDNLFQHGVNIGNLFAAMSNNMRLRNEIFPEEALKLEHIKMQQQLAITGDKTSSNTETTETSIGIVKSKMDIISAKSEMKLPISCTDQSGNKIPDAASYNRLMSHNSVPDQTYITSPENDSERYNKAGGQSAQNIKTGGTVRDQESHSNSSTDNVVAEIHNLHTKEGEIITNQRNIGNTIPVSEEQIAIVETSERHKLLEASSLSFEDIYIEDSDSEDDIQSQLLEPLSLRSYQQELAAQGLQGKNCIIVAPTGSGKTHVALKIIQEHMKQMRTRRYPKVIFLVEQGALAQQQAKICIKYLPYKVKLLTGESQRKGKQKSVSVWLAKRDILVVTAQLLVNALIEQDVRIDDFTLMVFDECHHAHANHSYNRIMQTYMDYKIKHKEERKRLPMILGLTASVGVGRTKTTEGAINWIKTMMANLDAEELVTVRVNIDELSEHDIVPEQVIKGTARRTKNYFGEAVAKIMEVTERFMMQSIYADCLGADKDTILKAPPVKGSDQYTQWISNLWRQTAKVFNKDARRFFTTCRIYLDLYNRAMLIYEDARVKDALDFLEDNVRKVNENIIPDETDNKMNTLYIKSKVLMDHCLGDVNQQNPKLDTLRNLIAKTYKENMDSRGIVFVKTRDLVIAIQNWMRETDELKALNPVKFVGAQVSGEKGGMTKNDQDNILQYFKEGKHKLFIATSVAEEGLYIQNCNLVIRYDHVTNEIAMVQARGRGRAEGSKYYVIASEEKTTAEKEELNMTREARMDQGIIHLQNFIRDHRQQFIQEINDLQLEASIQRELENANKGKRIIGDFEFEMRCGKCNEFICMSRDIKKIQAAHHAVIGEEIANHIDTIRMPKPTYEDENIKMGCSKVNCKKCGKNLGNIFIYRKAQFPVLNIENFLVSDSHGNTDVYKKWKKAPFVPLELTSQDLLDRARGTVYY